MSNSNPSQNELPDKELLYGQYLDSERWASKLYRKLCHKSLDIPDEDGMIAVDNSTKNTGFSGGQMLAAAAIAGGLPIAGIIGAKMLDKYVETPAPVQQIIQPVQQTERVIQETLQFGLGKAEDYLD